MNKLIVAAVATAVSGFVSAPVQAAPASSGGSSVTVVNTAAAPVPTTVQNVVGVDVLAGPDTRARIWQGYCTVAIGAYTCSLTKTVTAPAGMVMRVVGLTGVMNGICQGEYAGHVVLMGSFQAPGAADAYTRVVTSGTVLRTSPTSAKTLLQFQGNAFFTTLKSAEFAFDAPATCSNSFGDISVHYVLEPLA
ncbi:MAG TPA: hypothetical protein VNS57_16795 [Steroidobacteraceae bacterium]|nr:hypothetical protein [Steroidobacteraceae bacterium]